MNKIKFDCHRVNSRKDLLHFVEMHGDNQVYSHIGKNPRAWIDELSILNQSLTGNHLVGGSCLVQPPIGEPDFLELGNGAFLYRGEHNKSRGLWIQELVGKDLEEITGSSVEWTHYRMGTRAELKINQEFSEVPFKHFLPENFEKKARPVKKEKGTNKRPIFTFQISISGRKITVYAKGADVSLSYYSEKPGYRLTSIAGISRTTSKKEMEITLNLRALGVSVPRVIGYYEAPTEEFLFLEKVPGEYPDKMFTEYRGKIINQDAKMLAVLCLAGYRKMGFTDFDDKIFNGNKLFLIDVDECRDLYFPFESNFRNILLNPQDTKELQRFRRLQRNIFASAMRDAIHTYRDSLTPTDADRRAYVCAFYDRLRWKQPNRRKMEEIISFPKDYITQDNWMSMMSDAD